MRKFFALILAAGIFAAGPVVLVATAAKASDGSACYNVADADARTYCLARARKEPGQCYSIQNAAMRSQCLAEVRR